MFTGIISQTVKVKAVTKEKGGLLLLVGKPGGWKIKIGDSITVNGVCSTVKIMKSGITFQYMPETLAKSNVGELKKGSIVNLEQSLRASDRLDGHIVQGHVDVVGTISRIVEKGNSRVVTLSLPREQGGFMKLVAEKGSIALEGMSLTVVDVGSTSFTVHLIPYTWQHTNLHTKKVGSTVNLEFDVLAKYLARLISIK